MSEKPVNRRFQVRFLLGLVLAIILALINLSNASLGYSFDKIPEIRGVWLTNIDSDVLFKKENLRNAIAKLSQLNFNTLYPTVWNWGYTLYPSQVAESRIGKSLDPIAGLQGRDILQEIVEQGHQKEMAVIPWFEFGLMAPADSQLAKRHPHWLTQRQDGSKIWLEGNVHQRVWLNPLQPEVQKFITDLVVEIVSKYAVDGIQFDDHFSFPADFGYDPFTLKLYQEEHNGKLPPNLPQTLNPTNNCVVKDREWIEWTKWRSQKITNYLQQLFHAIKASKPKAIISLSPNPQQFSLNCYLLDWQDWQRKGLIEELIIQIYRSNIKDFQRELAQPELQAAKQHIPVGIGILSGLKGRPVSKEYLKTQIRETRQQKFAGVSFFFYESLWNFGVESVSDRQSLFKSFFLTPVKRPNLEMKSNKNIS